MPVIRMNYLELSPEQRREGAKTVRDRLKASLSNPNLTPDQQAQLHGQLRKVDLWEKGALTRPAVAEKLAHVEESAKPEFVQRLKNLLPKN
jgi:hypothetical protein